MIRRVLRLAPGSFGWLLRHELRVATRGHGPRRRWLARAGPMLLLASVPVAGGIALAIVLSLAAEREVASGGGFGGDLHDRLGLIGAGVAGLLVLMVSTASLAVLRAFHDRGDLDLLLSAPMPPARVLAAKAVGVTITVAAPFLLLLGPFALTSAVLGRPHWLGALAMVAVDAMLATAIAITLAGTLFRLIGARRARVAVQLMAALVGGTVFLLSQSQSFSPALSRRLYRLLDRDWPTPLDWPARAAIGEPLPLLALTLVAGLAAWAAARLGARQFAAAGEGERGRPVARTTTVRFHPGLLRNVVAKEVRLIARDPELIAQVALRLIYLIPMAALVLRGQHGIDPGPAIAAAATGFAGLLASSLAWIIVCAEDAPDLVAAAPRHAAGIARAKLAAACLLPVTLVGLAALAAASASAWAGVVTLGMGSLAAVTATLLQAWFGRAAPRAAFRRRQAGSFVVGVGEVLMAGAWSGTASLLARGSGWAAVPAVFGGMIVAGAIEARRGTAAAPARPSGPRSR